MRTLSVNGIHLLNLMDPNNAFITELASPQVSCITWPQRQHIIDIVQSRDRNDKLLEFLTRRSVADFEKFIKVLSKEQAHLVPFLIHNRGDTIFICNFSCLSLLLIACTVSEALYVVCDDFALNEYVCDKLVQLSHSCIDRHTDNVTTSARSVHPLLAHKHEDADAIHQLRCQ